MSSLVEAVLAGISDTKLLTDHHESHSALHVLIESYSEEALRNDVVPNLTPTSTGADLKHGITKMEIEDQVRMLYVYLLHLKKIGPQENPEDQEDRRFKRFALKLGLSVISFLTVMLIGAVTAIAVHTGAAPSNEVVSTFLKTASEIVSLIFSHNPPP